MYISIYLSIFKHLLPCEHNACTHNALLVSLKNCLNAINLDLLTCLESVFDLQFSSTDIKM